MITIGYIKSDNKIGYDYNNYKITKFNVFVRSGGKGGSGCGGSGGVLRLSFARSKAGEWAIRIEEVRTRVES